MPGAINLGRSCVDHDQDSVTLLEQKCVEEALECPYEFNTCLSPEFIPITNFMFRFTARNLLFSLLKNYCSTNEVSTASGDFGVSTAGGTSQVPSTPCAHDDVCLLFFLLQPKSSLNLENEGNFSRWDEDDLEELDSSMAGLAEYSIRNKIIKSQTTELNIKTSETIGQTNDANTKKPKSASESVVPNPKIDRDRFIVED
ncbi:hypothetical protein Tco_0098214 [Tanacetum coccineum]